MVFGCWLLAALLLMGHNGSKLATLLSMPVSGQSAQVKLASEKWRQLQDKMSQTVKEMADKVDLDLTFTQFSAHFEHQKTNDSGSEVAQEPISEAQSMHLPKLSGILHCMDINGNVDALAVIEGRRFQEKDTVGEFQIQKIEEKGVFLTKGSKRWFLKTPDVSYSFNHEPNAQGSGQ
ncbi:MAG: hypothetical protein WCE56_12915 [Desulfobacterales bacterium]